MSVVRVAAALCVGLGLMAGTPRVLAQTYPSKPVHLIVPVTAGSGTDVIARLVGRKLSEIWGQNVLVENRAGANGTIGSDAVAKARPDGYTLLVYSSAHVTNPFLLKDLPFDPIKDFVDVAPLASQVSVLVTGASSGYRTVGELVAAAKAKPGQLTFGSSGTGGGTHLNAEKFNRAAGIDAVHVPYKGGPEVNTDTVAARIVYWFPPVSIALPYIRDGRLLALGVTSTQRLAVLPQVPTIAEAGISGFDFKFWFGLWAPAATPGEVIDKLSKDVGLALDDPELRERLAQLGAEPIRMTPSEFVQFVRRESDEAARLIRAAGIRAQ